ncbi:MAG: MerR family transcriptional regulator [Planctomycetota bacterium]|nr:MAG: MerR family transcriptional regulator [Planctomycetota bacterium]
MSGSESAFDIAELAQRAQVSSRTIRYYGELGLLPHCGRGPGGRRLYGQDALERLGFIQRLKGLGLTLEEIGQLNQAFARGRTEGMLDELEALLLHHLESVHLRIEDLRRLHEQLGQYLDHIRRRRSAKAAKDPLSS